MVQNLLRVFFDADVLVSASFSHQGAAYTLMVLGQRRIFLPYTSVEAIKEVKRTINNKVPQALPNFLSILQKFNPHIRPSPDAQMIEKVKEIVPLHDTHVLASAMEAQVNLLLTFNLKDFHPQKVFENTGIKVLKPGGFLRQLRVEGIIL